MKLKKIFLIFCFMFLLTACDVEYNLVYENNKWNESLSVTSLKDEVVDGQIFSNLIDSYYNKPLIVNYKIESGDMSEEEYAMYYEVYNKQIVNENGIYGINLNYSYEEEADYVNSFIVHSVFNNIQLTDTKIIALNVNNIFENYKFLDKITIRFKTDKKVINTNADKKENDIYYWYIDKENYDSKQIIIDIDKTINILQVEEESNTIIKFVFIAVLVVILFGSCYVFIKVKNSNKK